MGSFSAAVAGRPRWTFLRHGRTTANATRVLCGHRDIPLADAGRHQAVTAGVGLARTLRREGSVYERILCSDLLRARQTALAVATAAGIPIPPTSHPAWIFRPELRERHMGAWEGEDLDRIRARGDSRALIRWEEAPPGGESLADAARRVIHLFASLPPAPTLVVTHGGVLRAVLGLLDPQPRGEAGRRRIQNAVPFHHNLQPGTWGRLLASLEGPSAGP